MSTYKRINQLNQTYKSKDSDFLAIDVANSPQTQKITKSDLFYGYITDAPNNESTKNWTWARRNGNWYRIYPDDYVIEAPMDGGIYVRVNGEWAQVSGVSGDMLRSIYDTHNKSTDIFDYADSVSGIPDNATESLLGAPIVRTGRVINKDYCINTKLIDFFINGETTELLSDPILEKSFSNPCELIGSQNHILYVSGKDLLKTKQMEAGSYFDPEDETIIHSSQPAKVNPGEKYTIKSSLEGMTYRFVSVNRTNEPSGSFVTAFMALNDEIVIPAEVEYIGVECRYFELTEGDSQIYKNFETPYDSYLINSFIPFDMQFNKYDITCQLPMYSIRDVAFDYIDFSLKKEYHNIVKETLTYQSDWKVSNISSNFKNITCIFEIEKEENFWSDSSVIYGNSSVLKAKSLDSFLISDEESIAFYNKHIYIRISYENLQRTIGQSSEELLVGLQNFLYDKPFDVIYATSATAVYDIELSDLKTYDSITNFSCLYVITNREETYFGQNLLEGKFENVVNNLIRKDGDELYGRLVVFGDNNLVVRSILGSDGNGSLGGPLYINNNNQEKLYVNGDNPVLDLRDFSTKIDWEPKVKTISEKEANDNRIVNAEYIHRDYAPLDSPSLVGTPTSTKAEGLGTNQIATGEFVEEYYYNKEKSDRAYIHSVDGIARGEFVLEETLPQIIENKKRIPNIEFIETYYHDKDWMNNYFAPIKSPNFIGNPTTVTPDGTIVSQITNVSYLQNNYLNLKGGSVFGDLSILKNGEVGGNVTVGGFLKLSNSPTENFHAATKEYVDSKIGGSSDLPQITIEKTLSVSTDWKNVGIQGEDLVSGSYIIQINNSNNIESPIKIGILSGIMSWDDKITTVNESDEIVLHRVGSDENLNIYLRTNRNSLGVLNLQIAANSNLESSLYTFVFKKIL